MIKTKTVDEICKILLYENGLIKGYTEESRYQPLHLEHLLYGLRHFIVTNQLVIEVFGNGLEFRHENGKFKFALYAFQFSIRDNLEKNDDLRLLVSDLLTQYEITFVQK